MLASKSAITQANRTYILNDSLFAFSCLLKLILIGSIGSGVARHTASISTSAIGKRLRQQPIHDPGLRFSSARTVCGTLSVHRSSMQKENSQN